MDQLILAWYAWLSWLSQSSVFALQGWADRVELPLMTAVLFGLIGALSPCQLTTSLSALAYASAQAGPGRSLTLAIAYVAGKVTVYSIVGALVILAGRELHAVAVPVVLAARKGLGPLMIVVGLSILGVLRLKAGFGQRLALRLRQRVSASGLTGAYLLGVAFSFAFCPTLFWLFFGLTIPLALRSSGGSIFPGLFAVGSSLPLLLATAAVATGAGAARQVAGGMRRVQRPLRAVAGAILIVAGLHDTLVYWVL